MGTLTATALRGHERSRSPRSSPLGITPRMIPSILKNLTTEETPALINTTLTQTRRTSSSSAYQRVYTERLTLLKDEIVSGKLPQSFVRIQIENSPGEALTTSMHGSNHLNAGHGGYTTQR